MFFLQKLVNSSNPYVKSAGGKGRELTFNDALDAAAARLETEDWSAQPEVKAELERVIGLNYYSQGKVEAAEKNLRASLAAQIESYGEDNPQLLETQMSLAGLLLSKADYDGAEAIYEKYLPLLREEYRNNKIEAAVLLSSLGDYAILRRARGDSTQAESLVRENLAVAAAMPPDQAEARESAKSTKTFLALVLLDRGKFDEAESYARGFVENVRQTPNEETPALANSLTMLGSVQMEKGDLATAKINLREAETIYRKLYSPNYIAIYDNLRLQAQTLYLEGNYAEADAAINRVLENYRQNSNPKYISFATALTVKGLILNGLGKSAEAEIVLREAVRLRRENLPEKHFMTAQTLGALGEILLSQKNYAEAELLLRESYDNLKLTQATKNSRTELAKRRLKQLYTDWNKPELLAEFR